MAVAPGALLTAANRHAVQGFGPAADRLTVSVHGTVPAPTASGGCAAGHLGASGGGSHRLTVGPKAPPRATGGPAADQAGPFARAVIRGHIHAGQQFAALRLSDVFAKAITSGRIDAEGECIFI